MLAEGLVGWILVYHGVVHREAGWMNDKNSSWESCLVGGGWWVIGWMVGGWLEMVGRCRYTGLAGGW